MQGFCNLQKWWQNLNLNRNPPPHFIAEFKLDLKAVAHPSTHNTT
jgi:hypothetical protein